jgi:hypothetical protein
MERTLNKIYARFFHPFLCGSLCTLWDIYPTHKFTNYYAKICINEKLSFVPSFVVLCALCGIHF